MRILFWSGNFWPMIGGAEVLAMRLILALQTRGFEVVVLTSQRPADSPRKEDYQGITIFRFPFRESFGNVHRLMELRQEVVKLKQEFAPDLIHINDVHKDHFFHLLTAEAYPAPSLVTLHLALSDQLARRDSWVRQLLAKCDWVNCVSQTILNQTRRIVPEIRCHSSVVFNGLEDSPVVDKALPMDPPRILCLGRLQKRKGFDVALSAFSRITHRYPKMRLTVAGDGPERLTLERQADELGLEHLVDFLGWVFPAEVRSVIKTSTVVVMPSTNEGFPLVALEAALMGRPVVASRIGGLSEVVIHRKTGLLVDPGDCAGMAEAISFLIQHPEKAAQLGQMARRRAQNQFSWRRCVDGYEMLYQSICKRAVHGPLQ
jgi:glycogen synthase